MSNRRRPASPPPGYEWLRCPDCDSTVTTTCPHPKVMDVTVEHSPTCPVWHDEAPELAVRLQPKEWSE